MALYDYLPTFHQVEPNNLKGLQAGFVVAQMEVKTGSTLITTKNNRSLLENGHICSISKDGIDIWSNGTPMFIHYTEPLNTVLKDDKYFAVELANENPRLVQLIPGDEWMTDIDYETDSRYASVKEELMKHIAKVSTDKGDWFKVSTLADGTPAYHYVYLG